MTEIIQWDLTYTGYWVTQKKAEDTLLNYMKANVVCFNPLDQHYFEGISIQLRFVKCFCKCHMQHTICWHGNCLNGITCVDAMCNIKIPIQIVSRDTGVYSCQILMASNTFPIWDAFRILKLISIGREPTIASAAFLERKKSGRNFKTKHVSI
jgi:hypothetical protein